MKIPWGLHQRLLGWALVYTAMRQPDFTIQSPTNGPYMHRWYVTPWRHYSDLKPGEGPWWQRLIKWMRLPAVYIHRFVRSDDDRALHDHPWSNCSIVLDGLYIEHRILAGGVQTRTQRGPGDVVFRMAKTAHRVELPTAVELGVRDDAVEVLQPITLFITGFKTRTWGFHCPNGWRRYTDFLDLGKSGQNKMGRGCD